MEAHSKSQDSLLEIGTEEIPSSYFPPALAYMKSFAESRLAKVCLPYKTIQVLGTPRRLSLLIWGAAPKSEGATEEVLGPRISAAKGPEGEWTLAAQGFAKSQGVSLQDLQIKKTPKGDAVCAVKKIEGIKAETILTGLFTELPASIPFPKKMLWNETGFKFARPIRNLVALYGSKTLRVSVAGVKSSNKTQGLSRTSSKKITITSPQNYLTTLKNHCVLVDPESRRQLILNSVTQLAKKVKGEPISDEGLLDEVTWLVEHPVGILGNFDPEFLTLPSEVLTTCMKKHQKFFGIADSAGSLLPHFVGIRNGISEHQDIVRKGYEKVLLARLYDAKFFFEEDLKKSLEFFLDRSSGILVQEKLGTVQDKIVRMTHLSDRVLEFLKGDTVSPEIVKEAIRLSKFDLVTRVVYEYPELQGIMGKIYALRFGKSREVAEAIREHYYPTNNQSALPGSPESKTAALCEKLDGLCGNFWLGNLPSGNADPYGLRRQSSGILKILLEARWDLPLGALAKFALEKIAGRGNGARDPDKIFTEVHLFLTERFQLLMRDAGRDLDEIYSVTKNGTDPDLLDLKVFSLSEKIGALHSVRALPDFGAVAGAYKRAGNILKQARQKGLEYSRAQFDPSLLKEPEEKNLHSMMDDLSRKARPLVEHRQYKAALQNWVLVRKDLDLFFDRVMVMDQDEKICRNRLSLLSILDDQFRQIADFSMIQNRG